MSFIRAKVRSGWHLGLQAVIVGIGFLLLSSSASARLPPSIHYSAKKPPPDDYLIVPGVRAGQFWLGMPLAQVHKLLGAPDSVGGIPNSQIENDIYWSQGLIFMIDHQGVEEILITANNYKTKKGVTLGMDEHAVRKLLGSPEKREVSGSQLYLDYRGLQITLIDKKVAGFALMSY